MLLDEKQIVDDWEGAVNSFLVDFDTDIYVQIRMQPLVFREFLKFHEMDNNNSNITDLLWTFLIRGGFPSIHSLPYEEREAYTLIGDIYDSIVLRDAVERFNIKNIELLDRILRFVMDNIGNTFSAKKIADYFKSQQRSVNQNTVYNYLEALESTFLINRVNRFDLHGKEILKTQEKFYLADQGILHSVHTGKIKDREIDFVATKGNKRVYLQVTYKMESENTINREFGPLLSVDDHYPKYVLSMDEHFNDNIEGVQHMKLIHFLTSNHWEK